MQSGVENGRGTISNLLLIHAWGPSYCSSVTLDWHPALMKETKQCIAIRHPFPNHPVNSLSVLRERGQELLQGWRWETAERERKKLVFFPSVWGKTFVIMFLFKKGVSRGRKTHLSCQRWLISSLTLSTRQCNWYWSHLLNNVQHYPQLRK